MDKSESDALWDIVLSLHERVERLRAFQWAQNMALISILQNMEHPKRVRNLYRKLAEQRVANALNSGKADEDVDLIRKAALKIGRLLGEVTFDVDAEFEVEGWSREGKLALVRIMKAAEVRGGAVSGHEQGLVASSKSGNRARKKGVQSRPGISRKRTKGRK